MAKLLLEKESRVYRENEQYEVEVKDLKEAVKVKSQVLGHWGASQYQFAETGRVTFEDGRIYYIGFNGRIWDGKYWEGKNGKAYNDEVKEILL